MGKPAWHGSGWLSCKVPRVRKRNPIAEREQSFVRRNHFWRDPPQSEGRYWQRRREQQVVAIEELPNRVPQDSALHQRLRIISRVETLALFDDGDEVRVHPAFPLGQERAETQETARYPENREKVPRAVEAGVRCFHGAA